MSNKATKLRRYVLPSAALCALLATQKTLATAQMAQPPAGPLDPARDAKLLVPPKNHLSEEFIWTANDAAAHDPALQAKVRGQDDKTAPHYFRAHFHLGTVPHEATLYIAGPRSATVYINGREVLHAIDDASRSKNLSVITADVASALRSGENVIAIEEVRGHSSLHTGASPTINQVTYGEVLAVKIVPRALAVDAPPVLVSNTNWRSTLQPGPDWQNPTANDSSWPQVESLGVLGSKNDFLQWNADTGLYAWPGYSGISSTLRVFTLKPVNTTHDGDSTVLDFGREISGRVRLTSNSETTTEVRASYGESPEEAAKDKGYLGTRKIVVPPHATVYGPKSGFRYVKLTMPAGNNIVAVAEAITYPVEYTGSFESSDPKLNRIWETAAYTARLCMQEGIWDGIKRDRGRWMGDLDVTGRTITSVFGSPESRALMEQTMADLIGEPPVTRDINTIVGYSALWITGQADFYRHTGDIQYLRRMHDRLLSLLKLTDSELDAEGLFTNPDKHKLFVDWSTGFNTDTPEARAATHLELTLAYAEAAYLLDEIGDHENAQRYLAQSKRMSAAAQSRLRSAETNTFGMRWQTNAMAVVANVANDREQESIWARVLKHVGEPDAVIIPYYGYYVLEAMAKLDHREDALQWMRTYWGGMLDEGATSFWESYDPHWPKEDFHANLEADNKKGYYVSLAHGWSSGPAAWLTEQVLGIQPTAAGFREVTIRPDLGDLDWARGSEPTPRGPIKVDAKPKSITITLPDETRATVLLPFLARNVNLLKKKDVLVPQPIEYIGDRTRIVIDKPGTYTFNQQ